MGCHRQKTRNHSQGGLAFALRCLFACELLFLGCSERPKVEYDREVVHASSRLVELPVFELESCSKKKLKEMEFVANQYVRFSGAVTQDAGKLHNGCVVTISVRKFMRKRDTSFTQKSKIISFRNTAIAEFLVTLKMPEKQGVYDLVVKNSKSGCEEIMGTIRVR